MSSSSSPPPDSSQPAYRRLKLVMSTPEQQQKLNSSALATDSIIKTEPSRSSSPARPSYSPVTPTLSHASITAHGTNDPDWIDEPTPLPVSLDENPDAIALQATLSLLQMQRQQSLRDIRGLNKIKYDALGNPEAFVVDLQGGKLSKPATTGISLDSDTDRSDDENESGQRKVPRFGKLPVAQNVARCPPIEWSKYRVMGEALDQLHELQRQHPGSTDEAITQGLQLPIHEVVAPYRPFTDKLDTLPPSRETRNYDR